MTSNSPDQTAVPTDEFGEGGFLAAHIRLGNALVEMIEPNGPNSFLHRYGCRLC